MEYNNIEITFAPLADGIVYCDRYLNDDEKKIVNPTCVTIFINEEKHTIGPEGGSLIIPKDATVSDTIHLNAFDRQTHTGSYFTIYSFEPKDGATYYFHLYGPFRTFSVNSLSTGVNIKG